jgi:hypothetical protein
VESSTSNAWLSNLTGGDSTKFESPSLSIKEVFLVEVNSLTIYFGNSEVLRLF